jgi:hypothetical protein
MAGVMLVEAVAYAAVDVGEVAGVAGEVDGDVQQHLLSRHFVGLYGIFHLETAPNRSQFYKT